MTLTAEKPQHSQLTINIAAGLMILFWALAYVGIRGGLKGYSPGSMALFRYLIASFCMLIIHLRVLPFRRLPTTTILKIGVLGVLGFTVYNIALNYGELTVPAGIASFIISQVPVVMTLFAVAKKQDRLNQFGKWGTAISFMGIVLIAIGESHGWKLDRGVLYVLIATLVSCIYALYQKPMLKQIHPIEFTSYAIWIGTAVMLVYLPQLIHEIPRAPISATSWVVFNGIFPATLAYLLWSFVLANSPTTRAASYLYLIPLVATLLGWLLLSEIPSWLSICGGLLALIGAICVNRGVISNITNIEMKTNATRT